ncbi:MAG: hypothetical protein JWM89_1516 [Acidimicrobiales bacterium]|nr:hypothetical protein [Acidimicrobiales bacterium]
MLYRIATIDFDALAGIEEMLTLTYPRSFPCDGPTCKAHLQAFRKRYERRWGPARGAWKLEFQRRGAPHFHLLILRPAHVGWKAFVDWCAQAWYEVVGSGDERHLRAGVALDRDVFRRAGKRASARRIAWYFAKHAGPGMASSKAYQNELPDGFASPGRFWGVWGVKSSEQTVAMQPGHAAELTRWISAYRRSQNPRARSVSVVRVWSLVDQPAHFLTQFLRWLRPPEQQWVHELTGEARSWPPGRPRPLP